LRRRRSRDREGHDTPTVQKEDPANRPSKQQFAAAVVEHRVPVHQLGEREATQCRPQHLGQHIDRGLAALLLPEREIHTFRRFDALESGDLSTVSRRETDGRLCRRAVGCEACRHRRAVHQFLEIGLALGQTCNADGQAPRSAVGFNGRFGSKTLFLQLSDNDVTDLRGETG
jgi:hypothetical protein